MQAQDSREMKRENRAMGKTYDMVYIGMFAVLMAICSWISIPTAIPFTLQTFAIFLAVGVLGGRRGTMAVLVYILLGAAGIPVFSGFTGGVGILMGNTGGYIIGFLFTALFMWGMEKVLGQKSWVLLVSMALGVIICYAFGTAWFMLMYAQNTGAVTLAAVLGWCVIPFLVPDGIKIALAFVLSKRLRGILKV